MTGEMSDFLVAALFVALLGAAGCGAAGGRVLLATNFETDPTQSGWTIGGYPNQKPAGAWIDTTSV